ncbi:MAG: ribosomal-processing cysteine protease Prp [Lachnospiraceae bacterium]|nr:ribosomal-processing cysteine protease Prp [Lachnospiraceae bacterium]
MIQISLYKDGSGRVCGFRCVGHAGFAESGSDIICAAVSALTMTAVNSIEQFTSDRFSYEEDEKKGRMDFRIVSALSKDSELLLKALVLGLSGIE